MPQVGQTEWKAASSFHWYREYEDGRVEFEYDPEDGHLTKWGNEAPTGLKRVGWLPMTSPLAAKITAHGEIGMPVSAPPISINTAPGDDVVIFKDVTVYRGLLVTCKGCNAKFRAMAEPDVCPRCGAEAGWGSFVSVPVMWEDVIYHLGIKDKFILKFNANGLVAE